MRVRRCPGSANRGPLFLCLAGGLALWPGPAGAQEAAKAAPKPAAKAAPAPAPKKGAAPADPADALAAQLRAGEDAAVDAAQKLAATPGPRALDVLLDELAIGVSPRIALIVWAMYRSAACGGSETSSTHRIRSVSLSDCSATLTMYSPSLCIGLCSPGVSTNRICPRSSV